MILETSIDAATIKLYGYKAVEYENITGHPWMQTNREHRWKR